MTDATDVLIQAALCAQLTTPTLGFPIAYPLLPYTPIGGVSFLEVRPLLKAQTQHPAIGYAGSDLNRGIFQVDAVIPDGIGEAAGLRLAGLVLARFPRGTQLAAGPYILKINAPPQTSVAIKDAAWVRFPVSIPYLVIVG